MKLQKLIYSKQHISQSICLCLLFLLLISTKGINAQEPTNNEIIRDSLLKTFPLLINEDDEQAKKNVEQALALNIDNKSIKADASGNYFIGKYYRIKGSNRTALKYFKKTYDLCIEIDIASSTAAILNEIGITHKNLDEYEKAIDAYVQGIELIKGSNSMILPKIYCNLSIVHSELLHHETSLKYLLIALELEEEIVSKALILINIGSTYQSLDNTPLAMQYFNKALKLCDEYELSDYYRNGAFQNIVEILIRNDESEKALTYLVKIKEYEESNNYLRDLIYTYHNFASAYKKMNDFENAELYINKSIKLAKETESNTLLIKTYKLQSDLYRKEHKFEKAIEVFDLYVQLKDSLFNIEKIKNTENLLADYEADRKESEILLLKKEKKLQQKELIVEQQLVESHKSTRNISIVVAVLLLIGAFLIAFFYQQKIRDGQLLALKTEEVNKQITYELLRDQEFQAIKAGINGREKERKRIAQELHDGIGGNLASIKLNLTNVVGENQNEKLRTIIKNIDDTYKEVRAISHNLISFEIRNHSFTCLVEKFLKELSENIDLEINLNFFPEDQLNALPNNIKIELYRIIQELMNNILKHAQASSVDIQIIERDESVNLMVEDNGVGYDTKIPTHGIGLKNILSRVHALNGSFRLESSMGNWTLANVEIPKIDLKN